MGGRVSLEGGGQRRKRRVSWAGRILRGLLVIPGGMLFFYFFLASPQERSYFDERLPGRTSVMVGRSYVVLQPPPLWTLNKEQEFVSPDGLARVWLEELSNDRGRERARSLQEVLERLRASPAEVERIQNWADQLARVKHPTAFQSECLSGYKEGLKLWRAGQKQPAIGRWTQLLEEFNRPSSIEGKAELAASAFGFAAAEVDERKQLADALWIRPKAGRAGAVMLYFQGDRFLAVAWKGTGDGPTPQLLQGFRPGTAVDREPVQGVTRLDRVENYAQKNRLDALFLVSIAAELLMVPWLAVTAAHGHQRFRRRYQLAHLGATVLVLFGFSYVYVRHLSLGGRGVLVDVPMVVAAWVFGLAASWWLGWRGSREAESAADRGLLAAGKAATLTSLGWGALGLGLVYALSQLA